MDGLKPRAMTRDLNWDYKFHFLMQKEKVFMFGLMRQLVTFLSPKNGQKKKMVKLGRLLAIKDSDLIHFIGKRQYCIPLYYFPAMMKAHGKYIMPTNVPAFEFLNLENDKISTSRNWAVWAHEYVEEFPGQQDVLRYALLSFLHQKLRIITLLGRISKPKNNSELVGIFGNFINRVVVLIHKYYDGVIPAGNENAEELSEISKNGAKKKSTNI